MTEQGPQTETLDPQDEFRLLQGEIGDVLRPDPAIVMGERGRVRIKAGRGLWGGQVARVWVTEVTPIINGQLSVADVTRRIRIILGDLREKIVDLPLHPTDSDGWGPEEATTFANLRRTLGGTAFSDAITNAVAQQLRYSMDQPPAEDQ
jgi:hypothetical protein